METIKLNIIPLIVPLPICHISQNDTGRIIDFELFENATPYSLSNTDVITLHLETPNQDYITKAMTKSGSLARLEIDEDISSLAGSCYAKINIKNTGKDISSSLFIIEVEKAP